MSKECLDGYGHAGSWCGPEFDCWLDPRSKEERRAAKVAQDFDAERALRLEAEKRGDIAQRHLDRMIEHSDSLERQVGELREQLAAEQREHAETERISGEEELRANGYATQLVAAEAKLDTAMGLLRSYQGQTIGIYERAWVRERNAFLNTISTEGKDHE